MVLISGMVTVGHEFINPKKEPRWYFHQSEKERRYEKIRENEEETEYMFYFWTVDEVNPFPCRYTLTVDKESNTVTSWKELRESDGKYHCVGNW